LGAALACIKVKRNGGQLWFFIQATGSLPASLGQWLAQVSQTGFWPPDLGPTEQALFSAATFWPLLTKTSRKRPESGALSRFLCTVRRVYSLAVKWPEGQML
jgi:hypothetical protein